MTDKEWQRRQDVLEGKSEPKHDDSNVASTDHTESRDDTSKSEDGNGGTQTQAEPDEQAGIL